MPLPGLRVRVRVAVILPMAIGAAAMPVGGGGAIRQAAAQEDTSGPANEGPDALDPTLADEGELPTGKFGVMAALRQNVGELGERYGFGWLWGFEAGYQPTRQGQLFSFGLDWSVLFGRAYASQPTIPDDPLLLVEMSFGTRVRTALGEEAPRFLVGSAGATMVRTSVPVPPDDERVYLGGYAGIGLEQYVGNWLVGLDARYGLIGNGPAGLTLLLSISSGSP